ncbi:MAG: MMPL family transporter, partial [Hyphomicrobiales bacterium]|nr:MMPL family transporter [Hyphomicrobiales bacterium]
IALTIAFGIAVDDSIHLVNRFNAERSAGAATTVALSRALDKVTPALVATTLVLCLGMMVTNLSSLPTAIHFGYVVIGTLLFALMADLYILPAMILTLTRASMKK